MDSSSRSETFCYETRCEHHFMKKWCMSYSSITLRPASKELAGYLECKNFKLKTKKKKISGRNVIVAPQAVVKDAARSLAKKLRK